MAYHWLPYKIIWKIIYMSRIFYDFISFFCKIINLLFYYLWISFKEKDKMKEYEYTITQNGKKTGATLSAINNRSGDEFTDSLFSRRSEKYQCTGLKVLCNYYYYKVIILIRYWILACTIHLLYHWLLCKIFSKHSDEATLKDGKYINIFIHSFIHSCTPTPLLIIVYFWN